ncbi:MAG: plasmid pRiA4b ORF-3 family protein [Chlorobaculum sp.]|nr:plasmid pRiA4b ORF-3 family protein [Chlorobaculum sp.]
MPLVHFVLQMVMGWENRHLHEFVAPDRKRCGVVDEVERSRGCWMRHRFFCQTWSARRATVVCTFTILAMTGYMKSCWRLWRRSSLSRRLNTSNVWMAWVRAHRWIAEECRAISNCSNSSVTSMPSGMTTRLICLARNSIPKRSIAVFSINGLRSCMRYITALRSLKSIMRICS